MLLTRFLLLIRIGSCQSRAYRGTVTAPGENSPYRNRSASENLALFKQMKNGAFPEGACTLRAKADMASPNMNLRDPVMYRIKHTPHHRTGTKWCIYPMYDWAHGQSDAIERVTHSLCSIEFAEHRPCTIGTSSSWRFSRRGKSNLPA